MPRSPQFLMRTIDDAFVPTAPIEDTPLFPHVITCRAEVAAGSVSCQGLSSDPVPGLSLSVIVGGQGTYVQLASDNVSYDGSDVFQADVTVENLIAQPLGTPDGTTVTGIKVFFHSGPTVTSGGGTVDVSNADGTGTFTASQPQPYFEYNTILQTNEVSAAKTWQWSVSPGVETFEFSVYVSTDIPVAPGEWEATPTPAFGTADFTVNDQSNAITFLRFNFDNYTCGSVTQNGSVGFGSTWPITDRQFTIDHTAMGDRFVFAGTFSTLGDHASGTWELTMSGNTCSGTWEGVPVNEAPTATIDNPSQDTTVTLGDAVDLLGTASDPDGAVAGHSWDFGDGTGATVEDPGAHTYAGAGIYTVTYQVTDDQGAASVPDAVTITVTSLAITTATLDDGHATLSYSASLSAAGGTGTGYTWSVVSGVLPSGIALGTQGVLSGTPVEIGSFGFTARVQDDGDNAAIRDLSLRICEAPVSLGPGGTLEVTPTGPGGCDIFVPSGNSGDNYRIAISRPSESEISSDVVTATLHVNGVGVTPAPPARVAVSPAPPRLQVPQSFLEALRMEDSTAALHARLREQERTLLRRFGAALLVVPDVAFDIAAPQAPAIRSFKTSTSCSTAGTPSTGFLVAENAHVAVYQDSAQQVSNPADGSAVQQVLDYYRDYGKGVIDDYFGGVTDINGDGQIVVFISPVVPPGAAAFVWAGNFVSSTSCAGSNEMELVYFNVTTINGVGSGNYQALATLVHEAKHVSSSYNRLVYGQFHPTWMEEGTAEIAGEMSSRRAWAANGGPALGAQVKGSDFSAFNAWNYGVVLRLARTVLYLSSQPNALTTNPDESPNHTIYGAGWHFHRLLGDSYGGAAFFLAQNSSATASGTAAFPSLTGGKTYDDLLSEYASAIMLNGTGAPQPSPSFASYDFVTACEIFSNPNPPGIYPWLVAEESFLTNTYGGRIGPSGLRIHDFTSNGTGAGIGVNLDMPAAGKLVIVRVQ
jgi:PKD repeat protein